MSTFRVVPATGAHNLDKLLEQVTDADGIAPISDGLRKAAQEHFATSQHADALNSSQTVALAGIDAATNTLAGFAVAAPQGDRGAAELVVSPHLRGHGLGRQLWKALYAQLVRTGAVATTWPWSHGDHPAAAHIASTDGYERARALLQIFTPRTSEAEFPTLAKPTPPAGISIRTFQPGDEHGWQRVNNLAFDWHPEQGNQSAESYAKMVNANDFDPRAVFFALHDNQIIGFHQTKMHSSHPSGLRVGEVYVIGVDPTVHARGVGRALMLAGMQHLLDQGAERIELYVESDNEKALQLYTSLGFSNQIVHVSYRPPARLLDGHDYRYDDTVR